MKRRGVGHSHTVLVSSFIAPVALFVTAAVAVRR